MIRKTGQTTQNALMVAYTLQWAESQAWPSSLAYLPTNKSPIPFTTNVRNVPGFTRSIGRIEYRPPVFQKCLCAPVSNVSRLTRLPAKVFVSELHKMVGVSRVLSRR